MSEINVAKDNHLAGEEVESKFSTAESAKRQGDNVQHGGLQQSGFFHI